MKSSSLFAGPLFALAAALGSLSDAALAETANCPFQGSAATLASLPGYKALASIDPVKVLDQLTISEAQMIRTAVAGPGAAAAAELDIGKAWAVFTDVPHFYNGGRLEYFALDKERFVLVSYAPEGQQRGIIARLKVNSTSLRELRKAHFETLAELNEGLMSCHSNS